MSAQPLASPAVPAWCRSIFQYTTAPKPTLAPTSSSACRKSYSSRDITLPMPGPSAMSTG